MKEMDGILNVYKEAGFTSFDVVAKLRGILKQKKIGHTGTLDPGAEGVLPVCVGRATKVCEYLTGKDKVYQAKLCLGVETDTQDLSGNVLARQTPAVEEETLRAMIQSFVGKSNQIPPMYSALKVNGKKLCDLARQGIVVERRAREIEIFSIDVLRVEMPFVTMRVHCSKGTYIRTLCHDIGQKLGCGGCMGKLLRTETAGFLLDQAMRLSEIEAVARGEDKAGRNISDLLIPVDRVLSAYPKVAAEKGLEKLLSNGCRIPASKTSHPDGLSSGICRMYDGAGRFVGLFCYDKDRRDFKVEKMF